jgi:glyoxylase-like metal-dependent hydrolase (beta-lactamase superfamily II)
MRVHHLNCGSLAEVGDPQGRLPDLRTVCHCLLIETDADGLVLVDTGIGLDDVRHPVPRLGADFVAFADPVLDAEHTAVRQVVRLGHQPSDVRHIVLTHLHRDHTGGLPDFPHATVHVHADEYRAVSDVTAEHYDKSSAGFRSAHHAHDVRWSITGPRPDTTWFGAPAITLDGLSAEILLVPLPGHTPGHSAVAVRTGDGWLLHAGDAYFFHGELGEPAHRHPMFEPIQRAAEVDADANLHSLSWLRAVRRDYDVDVFCAHDPWEFRSSVAAS